VNIIVKDANRIKEHVKGTATIKMIIKKLEGAISGMEAQTQKNVLLSLMEAQTQKNVPAKLNDDRSKGKKLV
jgi:hypothetical protein